MANYIGATRTNYFRVKDEALWKPWIDQLQGEDEVHDFTRTDEDGTIWHGFGCHGSVALFCLWDEDADDGDEAPAAELQRMLADDDACIVYHAGWEKLRFVCGCAHVITSSEVKTVDIEDAGLALAREMLGNDEFETVSSY